MMFKIQYFIKVFLKLSILIVVPLSVISPISEMSFYENLGLFVSMVIPISVSVYAKKIKKLKELGINSIAKKDLPEDQKIFVNAKKEFSEIKKALKIYFKKMKEIQSTENSYCFESNPKSMFEEGQSSIITIDWEKFMDQDYYTIRSKPKNMFYISDAGINRENVEKIKELLLT